MKISTRGEYGLRLLMELGAATGGLSLRDAAGKQGISLDYLEQIVPALKAAGLLKAKRGAGGGYQLAKPAGEITIYEALIALEGPLYPMACVSDALLQERNLPTCGASGSCAVQEVWREMAQAIENVLRRLTLGELLERQERLYGVPIRTRNTPVMELVVLN